LPRHSPKVVLVGRPNVGKSTLFNRMARSRRAIVGPMPGTTRDVHSQKMTWLGHTFDLIDTGGMFGASQDPLHALVLEHGRRALDTADLILFLVDAVDGCVPADEDVAAAVRSTGKPAMLVVNKVDDRRSKAGALEFFRLGFDTAFEVSAEHGVGTGDLLDEVAARLSRKTAKAVPAESASDGPAADAEAIEHDADAEPMDPAAPSSEEAEVRIAIVGRPNVGKSSLVNRILQEERVLVSDMPGTTRDAIDVVLQWHRRQFRIVDTAGIRRPGRVASSTMIEAVSVLQAKRAIERADVVVLVVDAVEGVTDQDGAIAGEAVRAGRGLIVAANKWDLMKDRGPDAARAFDEEVARKMKFLEFAPMLHVSARTGDRVPKLLETVDRVAAARRKRVATAALNKFVESITRAHPPASPGRREVRILYATQTAVAPPTFVFFTNIGTTFHFSYERFLVNQLRESFGFFGSPIRIQVRTRRRKGRTTA
jgi:GTP-binding protein